MFGSLLLVALALGAPLPGDELEDAPDLAVPAPTPAAAPAALPGQEGRGRRGELTWVGGWSQYEMIRVEPGRYRMGSPEDDERRLPDEQQHDVEITRPFFVGRFEITQALWERVTGENPAATRRDAEGFPCEQFAGYPMVGDDLPVMCVDWFDAVQFANALSERDGLKPVYTRELDEVRWDRTADGYRLPTEAEWEYAARAGTATRYVGTAALSEVCTYGNVGDWMAARRWARWTTAPCSDGAPALAPVGMYSANAWGLYDMVGNVWEWTWDWYGVEHGAWQERDPVGPLQGTSRVARGGSFSSEPDWLRVARRAGDTPANRTRSVGLRLVRSAPRSAE